LVFGYLASNFSLRIFSSNLYFSQVNFFSEFFSSEELIKSTTKLPTLDLIFSCICNLPASRSLSTPILIFHPITLGAIKPQTPSVKVFSLLTSSDLSCLEFSKVYQSPALPPKIGIDKRLVPAETQANPLNLPFAERSKLPFHARFTPALIDPSSLYLAQKLNESPFKILVSGISTPAPSPDCLIAAACPSNTSLSPSLRSFASISLSFLSFSAAFW